MKTWIKRSLIGLFGVSILVGGLAACGHRHAGWGGTQISAEDAVEDQPVLNTTARNSQHVQQTSWFEHPGIAAVKRARGLGL